MSENLGINLIEKCIKFAYDTTMESVEAFADKKIKLGEILGFSDNVFTAATLVSKWSEIKAQALDIDSEERSELISYTASLVKDATNDEVDIIIDNVILIIEKEIVIFNDNVKPIIAVIKK